MWTKSYDQNYTKFWAFWPKKKKKKKKNEFFYNHLWQRFDDILENVSEAEIIFNAKLLI